MDLKISLHLAYVATLPPPHTHTFNLDFTEARDNEWQWHQLGYVQVCTSLQTDNHGSIPPLCPSCRPTNSVKALKATLPSVTSMSAKQAINDKLQGSVLHI